MSLFEKIFSTRKAESIALIEIGPGSVGGAYVRAQQGRVPVMLYAKRIPYQHRSESAAAHGSSGAIIARAIEELGTYLLREGAPALARIAGSGSADTVVVSLAAPWQESTITVEEFEAAPLAGLGEGTPFTYTESLEQQALDRSAVVPQGRILVDQSVITTILNGYETTRPYGRSVLRASVRILLATAQQAVARAAVSAVRTLYHTDNARLTAYNKSAYEAVRALFPHEEEYLVLEVRGGTTNLSLIKRKCLLEVRMLAAGSGSTWSTALRQSLQALAAEHALPHTLFLLAEDEEREALKAAILGADLEPLWLSGRGPRLIALTPGLTLSRLGVGGEIPRDLFLSLLAIAYTRQI